MQQRIGLASSPDRITRASVTNCAVIAVLIVADRTQIEERMNFTRENYRMMREELLKIVYWKDGDAGSKPRAQDRIEAAKNVVMMDLALLSAEIANGMYKKPIEAMAREFRYDPLPPEVRAVVVAAWIRGDMLPRAAIEQMVPVQSSIGEELPSEKSAYPRYEQSNAVRNNNNH